jgi:hypothetical protein
MDFSWDNNTGPIDGRSPFAQVSSNAQRLPSSPSKKSECCHNHLNRPQQNLIHRSGTYSAFDSPSKSRNMGGQQSSPNKPLPPAPAFNSLFSTPRKPRPEIDDSSAGETPKSPERNNDSDATPEFANSRSAMTLFDQATAPTMPGAERSGRVNPTKERPQAERRDSMLFRLVEKAKNKMYSPGRGEIARSEHSNAIQKKRSAKHKRDVDRRVRRRRHSMSDPDEDDDRRSKSPRKRSGQKAPEEKQPHWISSLFTFIGQHPSVPHILSYYAQFLFNVFLLSCCGYLIYCFWSTVQADVDERAYEAMAEVLAEIGRCKTDYIKNHCDSVEHKAPIAETYCDQWKRCMERDYKKVGRARVSAHTFAQIFNSFVEPISWKAMIFTAILVFGCFGLSNFVSWPWQSWGSVSY